MSAFTRSSERYGDRRGSAAPIPDFLRSTGLRTRAGRCWRRTKLTRGQAVSPGDAAFRQRRHAARFPRTLPRRSAPRSSPRSAPSRASQHRRARVRPPTSRPRAGAPAVPLSPIDGMPIGIKDIIETADMPTEQGSPLFVGWRSERDARQRRRAARGRRGDRRQDRDHRVRRHRAARHPQPA